MFIPKGTKTLSFTISSKGLPSIFSKILPSSIYPMQLYTVFVPVGYARGRERMADTASSISLSRYKGIWAEIPEVWVISINTVISSLPKQRGKYLLILSFMDIFPSSSIRRHAIVVPISLEREAISNKVFSVKGSFSGKRARCPAEKRKSTSSPLPTAAAQQGYAPCSKPFESMFFKCSVFMILM